MFTVLALSFAVSFAGFASFDAFKKRHTEVRKACGKLTPGIREALLSFTSLGLTSLLSFSLPDLLSFAFRGALQNPKSRLRALRKECAHRLTKGHVIEAGVRFATRDKSSN